MAKSKKGKKIDKEQEDKEIIIYEKLFFNTKFQLPIIPIKARNILKEKCKIVLNPRTTGVVLIIYADGTYFIDIFKEKTLF